MNDPTIKDMSRKFGLRVAAARQDRGITQQQLADALGITSSETVSRYERGEREPRLSTIYRLATALQISPAELIGEVPASMQRELGGVAKEETIETLMANATRKERALILRLAKAVLEE